MSDLIDVWLKAKEDLEAAKQKEMTLRLLVVKTYSPEEFTTGSKTINTDGYKIKLTLGDNYSVSSYATVYPLLQVMAQNRGVDVNSLMFDPYGGKTLFRLKLEVNPTLLKAATADERMQLFEVVTVKPATPSVEITPA